MVRGTVPKRNFSLILHHPIQLISMFFHNQDDKDKAKILPEIKSNGEMPSASEPLKEREEIGWRYVHCPYFFPGLFHVRRKWDANNYSYPRSDGNLAEWQWPSAHVTRDSTTVPAKRKKTKKKKGGRTWLFSMTVCTKHLDVVSRAYKYGPVSRRPGLYSETASVWHGQNSLQFVKQNKDE